MMEDEATATAALEQHGRLPLEFWVGRDHDGDLWLFPEEPEWQDLDGTMRWAAGLAAPDIDAVEIDAALFPEVEPTTKRRVRFELI